MGKYATKEQLTALVADMASKINIASGTQGVSGSYVPIGCIEAFMGVEAPPDFLVCDGSLHSIASYPQLADHFYEQFGASNHFGGNGTTTFAVPDLRGEFLRGTGTNSHTNQGNGANVGEHQDASSFGRMVNTNEDRVNVNFTSENTIPFNTDSIVEVPNCKIRQMNPSAKVVQNDYIATTRPTNTSVLWCIKAIDEKIQPGGGGGIDYSTKEQDTGLKWIDGKPVYQKTIYVSALGNRTTLEIDTGIVNFDRLIDIEASVLDSDAYYGVGYTNNTYKDCSIAGISVTNAGMMKIDNREQNMSNCNGYITLKYTKNS